MDVKVWVIGVSSLTVPTTSRSAVIGIAAQDLKSVDRIVMVVFPRIGGAAVLFDWRRWVLTR
ncbi:hypothetical protein [uncultured Paracoccus sp.]|uniref:hypothetical protein n=1 Tax=uncultured Paracoccus sp. TaxID=189685 RepID=UPI0026339A38|nr:hypothetical protein [uncultured Paracoccus sp.]